MEHFTTISQSCIWPCITSFALRFSLGYSQKKHLSLRFEKLRPSAENLGSNKMKTFQRVSYRRIDASRTALMAELHSIDVSFLDPELFTFSCLNFFVHVVRHKTPFKMYLCCINAQSDFFNSERIILTFYCHTSTSVVKISMSSQYYKWNSIELKLNC